MPIKIIFTKPPEKNTVEPAVPVTVAHRVGHAIVRSPLQHRVVTFIVLAGVWVILEYVLKLEAVAHGVEVFGVAPFADRFLGFIFKEVE
jgi:hypothetical protein